MKELNINATDTTPSIFCNNKGEIKIEGRSLPENSDIVFKPLFEWIDKMEADKVVIDINLIYMNTSSSKQIFNLLLKLENDDNINSLSINWYYDEDDEEHLEAGEIFEEHLEKAEFSYHKHLSVSSL